MSQIFKDLTAGPVPPEVATQYTTDVKDATTTGPGTAIPAANNLNVLGSQTSQNNTNGIRSDANANNSANLYVELTNRITGTATTTDAATTQQVYSFDLGSTAGTYLLEVRLTAFNDTDSIGAGYTSWRVIRTDGAAATEISATPGVIAEEGTMTGVLAANSVSGNNALLEVNGLAGKTIYWRALTTYIFVSA